MNDTTDHTFNIGDHVLVVSDCIHDEENSGTYKVVAHMPTDGTIPRYQIKSLIEPFSRVASEKSLLGVFGPQRPAIAIRSKVSVHAHNEPAEVTLAERQRPK